MHQLEVAETNKKLEELEAEYKKLKDLEDQQAHYLNKIEEMKKEIIVRQYDHNDNMNKEELFQLKENKDLQSKFKGDIHDTKKNAYHQAINKIST